MLQLIPFKSPQDHRFCGAKGYNRCPRSHWVFAGFQLSLAKMSTFHSEPRRDFLLIMPETVTLSVTYSQRFITHGQRTHCRVERKESIRRDASALPSHWPQKPARIPSATSQTQGERLECETRRDSKIASRAYPAQPSPNRSPPKG